MLKKTENLIGAHVSVAGGYCNAITEGVQIGCTAIQIFTKSNRQWYAKPINKEEATLFRAAQQASSIKIVIAHASYLINLGSSSSETQQKSFDALIEEIDRCHLLGIPYLVLHPGSGTTDQALQHIGMQINKVIEQTNHTTVTILVETMAGQGKSAGSNFEQLAMILNQIDQKQRIGICFDTCHVFAAGYDFTTIKGYQDVMKKFDEVIGIAYLKALHMNDSKKELNSRVDRHENIGQGAIPLQAFSCIMNDQRLIHVPKILETPKDDGIENDKKNLQTLLELLE